MRSLLSLLLMFLFAAIASCADAPELVAPRENTIDVAGSGAVFHAMSEQELSAEMEDQLVDRLVVFWGGEKDRDAIARSLREFYGVIATSEYIPMPLKEASPIDLYTAYVAAWSHWYGMWAPVDKVTLAVIDSRLSAFARDRSDESMGIAIGNLGDAAGDILRYRRTTRSNARASLKSVGSVDFRYRFYPASLVGAWSATASTYARSPIDEATLRGDLQRAWQVENLRAIANSESLPSLASMTYDERVHAYQRVWQLMQMGQDTQVGLPETIEGKLWAYGRTQDALYLTEALELLAYGIESLHSYGAWKR